MMEKVLIERKKSSAFSGLPSMPAGRNYMQVAGRHNERVSRPKTVLLNDSCSGQIIKLLLYNSIAVFFGSCLYNLNFRNRISEGVHLVAMLLSRLSRRTKHRVSIWFANRYHVTNGRALHRGSKYALSGAAYIKRPTDIAPPKNSKMENSKLKKDVHG